MSAALPADFLSLKRKRASPFRRGPDGAASRRVFCACAERNPNRLVAFSQKPTQDFFMGRYLLLWLLGIPIPILLLIWLFGGLH